MDSTPQESAPSTENDGVIMCELTPAEGEVGLSLPPTCVQQPQSNAQTPFGQWDVPSLSQDKAREALVKYAADKRCHGTKPARQGIITNMEKFDTFRYILETFTEARSTEPCIKPYYGGRIDNSGQTPPGMWEIPVHVPGIFVTTSAVTEVPHTAEVKSCQRCSCTGKTVCGYCYGVGRATCSGCAGLGNTMMGGGQRQMCFVCGGQGRMRCSPCSATGKVTCERCMGRKKVETCINLVVQWTNNRETFTVEQPSGLDMENLEKVSGMQLFTESNVQVVPMTSFPNATLAQASERLVKEHLDKYSQDAKVLNQRQTVELLSITKVTYTWGKESHIFFVYGNECKVMAVDYPAACCWCCPRHGCTLL